MSNKIPEKVRQAVYERADRQCEICGATYGLQIHHIIPRRKRIHRVETLILLCGPVTFQETCHYRAENTELKYELRYDLQEHYFEQGYSEEEVRRLMGNRLYLKEGD